MSDNEQRLIEAIEHYQRGLEKYSKLENDEKVLYCIRKLEKLPITLAHLESTFVGRTMNSLRKYGGQVSKESKKCVDKWRAMIEDSPQPEDQNTSDEGDREDSKDYNDDDEDDREENASEEESEEEEEPKPPPKKVKTHEKSKQHSHRSSSEENEKPKHHSEHRHSDGKHHKHSESGSHKHSESSHRSKKSKHEPHEPSADEQIGHPKKRKHEKSVNGSNVNLMEDVTFLQNLDESYSRKNKKHKSDDKNDRVRKNERESSGKFVEDKKSSHKDKRDRDTSHESQKKDREYKNKSEKHEKPKKEKDKHRPDKKETKPASPEKLAKKSKKPETSISASGIDSENGSCSFAEALGMMEPMNVTKRRSSPQVTKPVEVERYKPGSSKATSQDVYVPEMLSNSAKLQPLSTASVLPELTTNYKPLAYYPSEKHENPLKHMSEEDALNIVISSKNQRTKVYSGIKSGYGTMPTLFSLCIRVLQDNIEALEDTGGVPYEILKPVLERANPDQLYTLEHYNAYFLENSDELWKVHCNREFRGQQREEFETYRDMYIRCLEQREAKFRALTENIKQSIDKSVPVRQTKLAYIDNVVKPPRNILKKQAKFGTGKAPSVTPTARLQSLAAPTSTSSITVPNPGRAASTYVGSTAHAKPKKAPLMQKTLARMKKIFRR